jgi:hypothetical protein
VKARYKVQVCATVENADEETTYRIGLVPYFPNVTLGDNDDATWGGAVADTNAVDDMIYDIAYNSYPRDFEMEKVFDVPGSDDRGFWIIGNERIAAGTVVDIEIAACEGTCNHE